MNKDEFEKAKQFLNRKSLPTSDDILNLFFSDSESVDLMNNVDTTDINFEDLGEADDIKTVTGTEWVATRLMWETPEGPISMVNLIKTGTSSFSDFNIGEGMYDKKPFPLYPFGEETIDIDYEDVLPLSYKEQLDIAIEDENFEEAARLRDWDTGLKKLMLKLKPKIIKALKDEDVKTLEDCLTKIRNYRKTL